MHGGRSMRHYKEDIGLTEDQKSATRREWKSTALKRSMCKTAVVGRSSLRYGKEQ